MSEPAEGVIANRAVVDLTHTTREDLAGISRIRNVGMVVAGESIAGALSAVPMQNVGDVMTVPDGTLLSMQPGVTTVGGESLGGPESGNEMLVVSGVLVITTPVTQVRYRHIAVNGVLLAPVGSEAALGAALSRVSGVVSYYPYYEGQQVKALTGQITLDGDALSNPTGGENDVLVAAGQLIVTTPVANVGYRHIIVGGQAILPRASRSLLSPALSVHGQTVWYGGTEPRVIFEDETFARAYFELLDEPISMIVLGDITLEAGVTPELLREKVADIALLGDVTAPKALIPMLQVLATERLGAIKPLEDAAGGQQ